MVMEVSVCEVVVVVVVVSVLVVTVVVVVEVPVVVDVVIQLLHRTGQTACRAAVPSHNDWSTSLHSSGSKAPLHLPGHVSQSTGHFERTKAPWKSARAQESANPAHVSTSGSPLHKRVVVVVVDAVVVVAVVEVLVVTVVLDAVVVVVVVVQTPHKPGQAARASSP